MKKYSAPLSICLLSFCCNAAGTSSVPSPQARNSAVQAQPAPVKCTSEPCGKTATGEDPQEVALRKANEARDKLAATGSDQDRWIFPLYSDSSKADRLQMDVVKAAAFRMRLLPKQGHLVFEHPRATNTFEIATVKDIASSTCPKYNVSIVDAGADYALVKMNCPIYEYKPNRFSMSSDLYLYDANSSIMRNVWSGEASGKGQKFPAAKPLPTVKKIADGYQFDWVGIMPNDPDQRKVEIHNKYQWTTDQGKPGLRCTDPTAPKGSGVENGKCEGGILPLVSAVKK